MFSAINYIQIICYQDPESRFLMCNIKCKKKTSGKKSFFVFTLASSHLESVSWAKQLQDAID